MRTRSSRSISSICRTRRLPPRHRLLTTAEDRLARVATAARQARKRKAPPRFEQFYAVRRFQPALAFTPDGRKLLFSTDISGQFNLWRVSVRRRLAGAADLLPGRERPLRERLAGREADRPDGRPRRRRVPPDPRAAGQGRVAGGLDGSAAGAALRRPARLVAGRAAARVRGQRGDADEPGDLGARRRDRRGAQGIRRRGGGVPVRLVAGRVAAARPSTSARTRT